MDHRYSAHTKQLSPMGSTGTRFTTTSAATGNNRKPGGQSPLERELGSEHRVAVASVRKFLHSRKGNDACVSVLQEVPTANGTRWKINYTNEGVLDELRKLRMPWGVACRVEKLWTPGTRSMEDTAAIEVAVNTARAGMMVDSRKGVCGNLLLLISCFVMLACLVLYSGGNGLPCPPEAAQSFTDPQTE